MSRLRLLSPSGFKVAAPAELLWALIGLILTIGGTFLEAYMMNAPWSWGQGGVITHSLGVSYQIAAVLLVGCLGGRNAALISQLAYLTLGLTWLDVFTEGGGFDYLQRPTFGYLLGFVPGAWICGWFAFRMPLRIETLALSCISGLAAIHGVGLVYLAIARGLGWVGASAGSLWEQILAYSVYPIPGQLAIVCAVTVIAYTLRNVLFY